MLSEMDGIAIGIDSSQLYPPKNQVTKNNRQQLLAFLIIGVATRPNQAMYYLGTVEAAAGLPDLGSSPHLLILGSL